MPNALDQFVRRLQNLGRPGITSSIQRFLGPKGTRVVRYLLGRAAHHHIQLDLPKVKLGSENASWMIHPDNLSTSSIVYSLGVGDEIAFDLCLIDKFSVDVYAFDPTPESITWLKGQKLPEKFHFMECGVLDYDGIARFQQFDGVQFGTAISRSPNNKILELKVNRLATIMKNLNHTTIDLLKINIEGAEYAVLEDLVASHIDVNQIVVEFHHRLPGYSLEQTKRTVQLLQSVGYKIFHISATDKEYSFIKI